jgi:4-hydroxy-tetrahydrodipicolinate synthase
MLKLMSDLRGVFAPIVTPFRLTDGEVDLPWIGRHVAYLRAHGCTGIIPCGTNGEAASLSVAERVQVTEAALAAAGDMPVIVGTGRGAAGCDCADAARVRGGRGRGAGDAALLF